MARKTLQHDVIEIGNFEKGTRRLYEKYSLISLVFVLVVLLVSSAFFADNKNISKNLNTAAVPYPFWEVNPVWDPAPTTGECKTSEFNVILLVDRSKAQVDNIHGKLNEYIKGVQDYLEQVSLYVRELGPDAKAHVIIGAYGTYNVWQNIPLSQDGKSLVRDQAWRDSIDISKPENLEKQIQVINDIYFTDGSTNTYDPAKPSTAYKGYTGLEDARSDVTDFTADNLSDALVQTAREVSRWTGGKETVGPDEDIDLVLAMHSGYVNVNDGEQNFPSKSSIFRASYPALLLGFPVEKFDDYSEISEDDKYYGSIGVQKLRSGQALNSYVDPKENGSILRDSDAAFDGKRPPVRVFGEAVVDFDTTDPWLNNMTLMFGIFIADYDGDPATGLPYNLFGFNLPTGQEHTHWDKTIGTLTSTELTKDLLTPMAYHPCVPTTRTPVTPELGLEVTHDGQPILEGQNKNVDIKVTIPNDPANKSKTLKFDYSSLEIVVNGDESKRKECKSGGHSCMIREGNQIEIPIYLGQHATVTKVIHNGTVITDSTKFPRELSPGDEVYASATITYTLGESFTNDQIDVKVNAMARAVYSQLFYYQSTKGVSGIADGTDLNGWTYATPAETTLQTQQDNYPS